LTWRAEIDSYSALHCGILELIRLSATTRAIREALSVDQLWAPFLARLDTRQGSPPPQFNLSALVD
jgi:hypothetical protein